METASRWARLVGGHVALDFVNTDVVSEHDRPSDVLRSADEFTAWCAYAGVPGATRAGVRGANGDELLDETRSLRTAIRTVVESIAAGRAADDQALSTLQSAYTTAISHAIPAISDDRLSWRWATPTPKALVWELTTSAVRAAQGRPDRPNQGVPDLRLRVPGHHEEPQQAVVLDGRLRQTRKDPPVYRETRRDTTTIRPLIISTPAPCHRVGPLGTAASADVVP